MEGLPAGIALAVAALSAGFLFRYGGRGRPLGPAEIDTCLRRLAEWAAIQSTHVFPVQPLLSLLLVRSSVLILPVLLALAAAALAA